MTAGKLTTNIQEGLVTLLCFNEEQGKIAAGILDTSLLEPPFDDLADRAIAYRKQYGKPPGIAHVDDLFDHILSDPKHKRLHLYQQILGGVVEHSKSINAPYILSRLNAFTREQHLKAAVIQAGERYQQGGPTLITDVELILHKALKLKQEPLDSGVFLLDKKRILGFLNHQVTSIALGIPELDRRGIGPVPGEMMAFMAAKGRGKTFFCIHAGVMALLQGKKVVHITLEMSEDRIMPRYLQRLFAVAKRNEEFEITKFVLDKKNTITDFARETQKPELYFADPRIDKKLARKMDEWGERFGRLVVKSFPSGMLTVGQLEAYLDGLEASHKFTPDVLIIDYPDLMSIDDRQDHRIALGRLYVELRGIFGARNVAGIVPIQTNRKGESARLVTSELIGEDYSKSQTADVVLTYNQTALERDLGLARIFVDKARGDEDKFSVLISQNYKTGQFCVQSAFMPHQTYWKMVKNASGVEEQED